MSNYIHLENINGVAVVLCNRCGCLVSGARLGSHDVWHLMLGEVRVTADGEPYANQPPATDAFNAAKAAAKAASRR